MRKSGRILLALIAAVTAAGCAEGQGDVNRVQPNYYPKSQFQGEWFYRDTAIDVPYETVALFEGYASSLERIRWEVQENALIAYRTTEHVVGANGAPDTEKPEFHPIAAWAISSHFDIVREYNPATGEQTNVISENTSDRPWWAREYIRVDWSRNIVANYNSLATLYSGITDGSGADYWVQGHEEANPDRVEVEPSYIGIVGKYNVVPFMSACFGFTEFLWGDGDSTACAATTVKVRSSFVKIDPRRPRVEPRELPGRERLTADLNEDGQITEDEQLENVLEICTSFNGNNCTAQTTVECTPEVLGALAADPFYADFGYTASDCFALEEEYFDKFGYFRTERPSYDRERRHHEKGKISLANRWNIWESSYDSAGMPLPYAQRKPKPVVYYLNADFPEDLFDEAETMQSDYASTYLEAVAALQGKPVDDPAYTDLKMFQIRRNSCSRDNVRSFINGHPSKGELVDAYQRVTGTRDLNALTIDKLERVCSALEYNTSGESGSRRFTWQKNGDLRYSFVYWVDRPQLVGPLGFGPSYADPLTGEMISGTAYVYGAGVDSYAAVATDYIQVFRGKETIDEVLNGSTLRQLVNFGRQRESAAREAMPGAHSDLQERLRAFELSRGPGGEPGTDPSNPGAGRGAGREAANDMLRAAASGRMRTIPQGYTQSRLDSLLDKDPELARRLVDDEQLMLAGWRDGQEVTPELLKKAGLQGMNFERMVRQNEEMILKLTGDRCLMLESFSDPSIIGLAMSYEPGNKTREEIQADLRSKIFIGVTLHEIGHTVGLRHNFAGSFDALNYFDRFWEIRSSYPDDLAGAIKLAINDEDRTKLQNCLETAEKWGMETPPTSVECLQGPEYKYSSIMDYGARFNSDFQGLGKYDKAAIRFGYDLVDVFDQSVVSKIMETAPAGRPASEHLSENLFVYDYKKIPTWLGGRENITKRSIERHSKLVAKRALKIRAQSASLPKMDVNTRTCTENCGDLDEAVEVPYRFCEDLYASYYDVDCRRWDEGASQEEIVDSAITRMRTTYPFSGFRRGRIDWNPGAYVNDFASRGAMHFIRAYQWYLWYGRFYEQYDFGVDLAHAAIKGMDYLAEVIQQPENGWYCQNSEGEFENQRYFRGAPCNHDFPAEKFRVPTGIGKAHWSRFSRGIYFNYESLGSYLEKRVALQALAINNASFFAVDNADVRRFAISYYQLYRPEMTDLMSGLITGDYTKYAPSVIRKEDGTLQYQPRSLASLHAAPAAQDSVVGLLALTANTPDHDTILGLQAGVFGVLSLTSPYDRTLDFNHYLKGSVKGSWDDVSWGADCGVVNEPAPGVNCIDYSDPNAYIEMRDPMNNRTYTAVNTNDGRSITHKLVLEANDYLQRFWTPAKKRLDAAPTGSEEYGRAKEAMDLAEQEFRQRLEIMDEIRRFNRFIELGT